MSTNHQISLQAAIDMTKRYRSQHPGNFPICETFALDAVQKLIATNGCTSIRIYYGMKEDNLVHAILVAVNAAGEDILPNLTASATGDAVILEDSFRCPDDCPPSSSINTD